MGIAVNLQLELNVKLGPGHTVVGSYTVRYNRRLDFYKNLARCSPWFNCNKPSNTENSLKHCLAIITLIHDTKFYFIYFLQFTCVELTSLHKQRSLSHKDHKTFSSRAMASSYMFQKAVYQQEYQKHS